MATSNDSVDPLANSRIDNAAALARAVFGAAPVVGSALTELVSSVIPNQRVDRLARFARELETRLGALGEEVMRLKLRDESLTSLVEEAMRHVVRSTTQERIRYIAALVSNGINKEQISYAETEHLLRILGELNDVEVIWLRGYLNETIGSDKAFRELHKAVLEPVRAFIGSDRSVLDKAALQESYKQHLASLGLLAARYRPDRQLARSSVADPGKSLEIAGYRITSLGRLLLRSIDLSGESSG